MAAVAKCGAFIYMPESGIGAPNFQGHENICAQSARFESSSQAPKSAQQIFTKLFTQGDVSARPLATTKWIGSYLSPDSFR